MSSQALTVVEGRALAFGHHVNADQLHPPAFFSLDPAHVRRGFLAGIEDPRVAAPADSSWIIVAGRNFGCGSSRETTLQALAQNGVRAVVAQSFGRIFYRSAIARALPCWLTEHPVDESGVVTHDWLSLDPAARTLACAERNLSIPLCAPDPFIDAVLGAGGLLEWMTERQR